MNDEQNDDGYRIPGVLHVRVVPAVRGILEQLAEMDGRSLSSFVRKVLIDYLNKRKLIPPEWRINP